MPGQLGNAVFAGHRHHIHPFRRINELVAGDEIIFQTAERDVRLQDDGGRRS